MARSAADARGTRHVMFRSCAVWCLSSRRICCAPQSVSYQLAHETARELEVRGEYCRAAELMASVLADEAQRINQRALAGIDLAQNAEQFKNVTVSMAQQQQLGSMLLTPLLDERKPALFGACLANLAGHRVRRAALPRPHQVLAGIAQRWFLPTSLVCAASSEFAAPVW